MLDRAAALPTFAAAGPEDTKITVSRTDGEWSFGTAVLLAPHAEGAYPEGWLFLARSAPTWEVAFEDEPAFAAMAAVAPTLSSAERALFSADDSSRGVRRW